MTTSWSRWKGLRALLTDAVEQGTSAVERVHKATAARPFGILEKIPVVAPVSDGVRLVHDATVAGVYETIRQVNRAVGATLSAALDAAEKVAEPEAPPAEGPPAPREP
jgi:hypothetical protein